MIIYDMFPWMKTVPITCMMFSFKISVVKKHFHICLGYNTEVFPISASSLQNGEFETYFLNLLSCLGSIWFLILDILSFRQHYITSEYVCFIKIPLLLWFQYCWETTQKRPQTIFQFISIFIQQIEYFYRSSIVCSHSDH